LRKFRIVLALTVLGVPLIACAHEQLQQPGPRSSPQDLAYCAKLSQLYLRYVGASPGSESLAGVTPDVDGGEAVAKCREGDARASIPVLERLLRDADMTLPERA
jgi:hypothetical protein